MDAQLNSKLDRLLQLLEPPKPKAKKTFEEEVAECRQRAIQKYLRKNLNK